MARRKIKPSSSSPTPTAATRHVSTEFLKNLALIATVEEIPVTGIFTTKQFRKHFDEAEIQKLAQSIKDNGFQGAVTVKRLSATEQKQHKTECQYLLIVGESRLRAMKELGKATIPADIKPEEFSQQEVRRLQADENLVRNDLNPLEEAETILWMMADALKCSIDDVISLVDNTRHQEQGEVESGSDVATNKIQTLQDVLCRYKGEGTRATPISFIQHLRKLRKLDGLLLAALQRKVPSGKLLELISLKKHKEQLTDLIAWIEEDEPSVKEIRAKVKALKAEKSLDETGTSSKQAKDSVAPKPEKDVASLPTALKTAVHQVIKTSNWKHIEQDEKKLSQAKKLLKELNALLEG